MKCVLKFKVLGKWWRIRKMTKKQYRKKHGEDSIAITVMHKRRIDISPRGMDLDTICHELVHVYTDEMCVRSMDFTLHDMEEFYAELLSKRGLEIIRQAEKLFAMLKKAQIHV